jgi:CBS domain-containing protein
MAVGSFSIRYPVPSLASVEAPRPGVGSREVRAKEDCVVKVSEVMTKEVVTVGPHYNVADVASLMDAKGIGSVIVLEEERVMGILTERDILKVIGAGEDPKNVAAHEALIGDLYTIAPDALIEDAANQMTQARVRHLPVIADDRIVGIISIRDVVRWSVREMAQATELPHMDVSHQVLSIVHPVDSAAGKPS